MYALLSLIFLPIIWIYVHYRKLKGLDDTQRFKERFGLSAQKRPPGRLVWFHSASVGETLSLQSFVVNWHKRYPCDHILITTTTITAAKLVAERFNNIAFHQFMPFDVILWVNRFLKHWKPDQAFFVESEIWPNAIQSCKKKNIPLTLLNARLSNRSFNRWNKIPKIAAGLLNQFTICLAQGKETADRLKMLGVNNVKIMANLKFSVPALPLNKIYLDYFSAIFNERHIWMAASTHPGEEELIFYAHKSLKEHLSNLITIIAPRHPQRANSLIKKANALGLKFQTLSEALLSFDNSTDGIIIDSIGQLGTFYMLSDIIFMGGSLIPHGGQNPIEPSHFKKPVLFGPHMYNFNEVCDLLLAAGALKIIDVNQLVDTVLHLFNSPNVRNDIGNNLYTLLQFQQKDQEKLIETLRNESAHT